jgi:hypothetical protein
VCCVPHSQHQSRELLTKLLSSHAYNHSQPSWFVVWIQNLTKLHRVAGDILSLTCSKYSTRNIGISCQPNFALPIPYHLLNILKGLKLKTLTSWQNYTDPNEHFIKLKKGSIKRWEFSVTERWQTQGIGNSTKKLIVCSIKLTSALTNPEHVCR